MESEGLVLVGQTRRPALHPEALGAAFLFSAQHLPFLQPWDTCAGAHSLAGGDGFLSLASKLGWNLGLWL